MVGDDEKIILRPVDIKESGLKKVQQKIKELGITYNDMENAIKWARQK